MGSKKKLSDEDYELVDDGFNVAAAANKLPTDVRGGKEPLSDFMNLPVGILDPFSLKNGSDFTRPSGRFYEQFVASVIEIGIIEPLTVRTRPNGRYEILAGETRWSAAKEAGLRAVPCHIIEADDAKARKIFAWTNLLRRDLKMRDRINGWWQYYTSAKEEGNEASLRDDATDNGMNQYVSETNRITYRQIMRYVSLHKLISDWIDLLETDLETNKPVVTMRVGIVVSKFDTEKQTDLLPYAKKLTEQSAATLLSLSNGTLKNERNEAYPWNKDNILKIINGKPLEGEENGAAGSDSGVVRLGRLKSNIMKVAKSCLRPEDWGRAPEIIQEALELYYKSKS